MAGIPLLYDFVSLGLVSRVWGGGDIVGEVPKLCPSPYLETFSVRWSTAFVMRPPGGPMTLSLQRARGCHSGLFQKVAHPWTLQHLSI